MKSKIIDLVLWLIIGFLLVGALWPRPYDDTDDIVNKVRSGIVLYTDYNTGCQYLSSRSLFTVGTLVPRVDSAGKHMC